MTASVHKDKQLTAEQTLKQEVTASSGSKNEDLR